MRQNFCARRREARCRLREEKDAAEASDAAGRPVAKAGITDVKPEEFTRYGSARTLYNFNIDNLEAY